MQILKLHAAEFLQASFKDDLNLLRVSLLTHSFGGEFYGHVCPLSSSFVLSIGFITTMYDLKDLNDIITATSILLMWVILGISTCPHSSTYIILSFTIFFALLCTFSVRNMSFIRNGTIGKFASCGRTTNARSVLWAEMLLVHRLLFTRRHF